MPCSLLSSFFSMLVSISSPWACLLTTPLLLLSFFLPKTSSRIWIGLKPLPFSWVNSASLASLSILPPATVVVSVTPTPATPPAARLMAMASIVRLESALTFTAPRLAVTSAALPIRAVTVLNATSTWAAMPTPAVPPPAMVVTTLTRVKSSSACTVTPAASAAVLAGALVLAVTFVPVSPAPKRPSIMARVISLLMVSSSVPLTPATPPAEAPMASEVMTSLEFASTLTAPPAFTAGEVVFSASLPSLSIYLWVMRASVVFSK